MDKKSFLVVGAGAWGTALSIQLANNGLTVSLTSNDKDNLRKIARTKENEHYLPGFQLPDAINIETFLSPVSIV